MEIKGIIKSVTPVIEVGTEKKYKKREFVIEEQKDQYPNSMCITVFGDDKIDNFKGDVGSVGTAHVNFRTSEYNGRTFTNIDLYKFDADVQQAPQEQKEPAPIGENADKLPF